jgi:hypothetical protein
MNVAIRVRLAGFLPLLLIPVPVAADKLVVDKTDQVGRKVANEYFVADLSSRAVRGQEEDSGTLRALTYKQFDVTLLRTQNRMHWAPNLSRVGATGYSGLGTWQPVQQFRESQTADEYIHHRKGHFAAFPEVEVEAEYRFFPGVPYFVFWSRLVVQKPLVVRLVRNNEMTMNRFFTHVAWPSGDGKRHVATFDDRHALLEKEPIAFDVPWLAFLNLDRGYGYGFVSLECSATKTVNPGTGISDGAEKGKYWSRRLISRADTPLSVGDQFEERTAYVLFRCSKEKPLDEFIEWETRIRQRSGRTTR